MTSPIIQPGWLTFGQSPPSSQKRLDTGEKIGMDLERISTNIAEQLNIGSKTTDNTETNKMETNKISPISDVKFSDEMSRDVEVKPKKQSKLGKIKAQLST